jgi:hypothetical protein
MSCALPDRAQEYTFPLMFGVCGGRALANMSEIDPHGAGELERS